MGNINLGKKKIIVIGDIMLDTYLFGEVDRISPESPVPVIDYTNTKEFLGGSGNVIRNLFELGINSIIFGFVGSDIVGDKIISLLTHKSITNNIIRKNHINSIEKKAINVEKKIFFIRS